MSDGGRVKSRVVDAAEARRLGVEPLKARNNLILEMILIEIELEVLKGHVEYVHVGTIPEEVIEVLRNQKKFRVNWAQQELWHGNVKYHEDAWRISW